MQQIALKYNCLALFELEDFNRVHNRYCDGELIGALYSGLYDPVQGNTIHEIRRLLEEHRIVFETLRSGAILVRNSWRKDVDRVDQLLRVNKGISILTPSTSSNIKIALEKQEHAFKMKEDSEKENALLSFNTCTCGKTARILSPRVQTEKVRISIRHTPPKEQKKMKVHDFDVNCTTKTFLITNPFTFCQSFESYTRLPSNSYEFALPKGSYQVIRIENKEGIITGFTIEERM